MTDRLADHLDLLDALSLAGRRAVAAGFVVGSGGNLSARRPGSDRLVVTASGAWLDALHADDFSLVDLGGAVLDGAPTASSELPLHLASYRARPDAGALIHLHPQHCVLLDVLGHPIRLLTTDHLFYVRTVARVPFLAPGTDELAAAGAAALADADCVILAHHGCSVVADTVEVAYKRAANLEEAAQATYRALLLGDTATGGPPGYLQRIARLEADTPPRGSHQRSPREGRAP